MYEPAQTALHERMEAMMVPGGVLESMNMLMYSNDGKQRPKAYPYMALDWTGTKGLSWTVSAYNPRIPSSGKCSLKVGDYKVAVSLFARGKATLDEADRALQDLILLRQPGEIDKGLIPAVALLARSAVVDRHGDRWLVKPGSEIFSARVDGSVNAPFCVGAGIILSLDSSINLNI